MGKKLAIKGHPTRGNEVIELLEMLGGKNNGNLTGNNLSLCYLIDDEIDIVRQSVNYVDYEDSGLNIFTLEEFLEKYPFKVGDKVVYTKFGDNCDDYPETIKSMKWTGTTIEYTFNDCVTCLAKDLKMWNGEPDTVISGIYLNSCDYADEVELNLGDYEIEVRDGRTYAVKKKPKYPKTFEECSSVINKKCAFGIGGYKGIRLYELQCLLICRDAYWKIAGDYNPEWVQYSPYKYCITYSSEEIKKKNFVTESRILAFPTEEMRDAFYENFKDLIEQCKELL